MILALKNGKLIPPKSPVAGQKRARLLAAECARIEEQLRNRRGYPDWRQRAEQALRMHNMELRLLTEWLEQQTQGMLKRAVTLLNTLVEDETDFEDDERALINELNNFVQSAGNSVG